MSDKQKYINELKQLQKTAKKQLIEEDAKRYKNWDFICKCDGAEFAYGNAILAAEEILKDPENPKTNGDKIRTMSDEELAEDLASVLISKFEWDIDPDYILKWLKQEVKDE